MVLINLNFNFFAITFFCIISIFLSILLLLFSYDYKVTNNYLKNGTEKLSPYECGFEPFSAGSGVFDVHFYIVGILFIIFDLEIVFLYPWAVNLSILGVSGFFSMLIFLFVLTIGFVFEWNKGALDWTESLVLTPEIRTSSRYTKGGNFQNREF